MRRTVLYGKDVVLKYLEGPREILYLRGHK